MNNSDVLIETSFLLAHLTSGNPDPSFQLEDKTNYGAYGIANSQVVGIMEGRYGSNIFYQNLNYASPDVTRNTSPFSLIKSLPVDANGKVINASYQFNYSIKVTDEVLQSNTITAPVVTPFSVIQLAGGFDQTDVDYINTILANASNTNVRMRFYDGSNGLLGEKSLTILSATDLGVVTIDLTDIAAYASITHMKIIADSFYTQEFTYSFCNKNTEGKICVTSNCLTSQLTVTDETVYPEGITVSSRDGLIQYPRTSLGVPVQPNVSFTDASKTIGPNIYTGNYTATIVTSFSYLQGDLIVSDQVALYKEHNVVCETNICEVSACISSLRSKYMTAVMQGSAHAAELFQQNFNISLMVNDYFIALQCKDGEKVSAIITELSTYLEKSAGCSCGCGCGEGQGAPTVINPLF